MGIGLEDLFIVFFWFKEIVERLEEEVGKIIVDIFYYYEDDV